MIGQVALAGVVIFGWTLGAAGLLLLAEKAAKGWTARRRADDAAEVRATAVSDAIEAGDQEALLIATGLIPDPSLADLPAVDAAELQAVIYPSDIIAAGGAR